MNDTEKLHYAQASAMIARNYTNGKAEDLTAGEIVEGAAKIMDENWPDWYNIIDLKTFNIQLASSCVLGQMGSYYREIEILEGQLVEGHPAFQAFCGLNFKNYISVPTIYAPNADSFDFEPEDMPLNKTFAPLQVLWLHEIEVRKNAASE